MNKFFIIFGVSMIFLISTVSAENSIELQILIEGMMPSIETFYESNHPIQYTVFNDFVAELYSVQVINENIFLESDELGLFEGKILDEDGNELSSLQFNPSFYIYDSSEIMNPTVEILYFPLSEDVNKFVLYYFETPILEEKLNELLCNNNLICDEYENYLSCSDCNWYDQDELCTSVGDVFHIGLRYWEDHFCDPDCLNDDDCSKANCNDNIQNQDETTVDSGGICDIIFCNNGIQDINEQGIDCGGNCPQACPSFCGDGICEVDETIEICPQDCSSLDPIELINKWLRNQITLEYLMISLSNINFQ